VRVSLRAAAFKPGTSEAKSIDCIITPLTAKSKAFRVRSTFKHFDAFDKRRMDEVGIGCGVRREGSDKC
jgi:hypothetical protein